MKSRIDQNRFKSILNDGYRKIETEDGDRIEFSSLFKEIINAQAPEIIFTDWTILKTKEWSVNAEHEDLKRKISIIGSDINDCIQKAKDFFEGRDE